MIELTIGKNDFTSKSNAFPFEVRANSYNTRGNVTDMTKVDFVARGEYLRENDKPASCETSHIIEELKKTGNYKAPIIVFSSINIDRELSEVEKRSRDAIAQFCGTSLKDKELSLSNVYKQIENFKNTLELLKDKQKVNSMLPVPVEQIAFFVKEDTEEDFILDNEAEIIGREVAPNGNSFSIYILKEWED